MKIIILILISVSAVYSVEKLNFIELVERWRGYTAEEYTLQSDDGYILRLHRISGSTRHPKARGKPVVYMQHCLFCSSDTYVQCGQNYSLGLLLADNGYDVWIGNMRGNAYSRSHIKYSPDNDAAEFYKFSLDEPSLLDVPKYIDFALEETNQEKLTYIGYSMGTTYSYMLLTGKPEYNKKINLLINIAPAVIFSRPMGNAFEFLGKGLTRMAELRHSYEIMPQSTLLHNFSKSMCNSGVNNVCNAFLNILADGNNLAPRVIPESFDYFPAGTSYYILKHFYQLSYTNKRLMKFDWNAVGQKCTSSVCSNKPQEYNLSLVTVPTALFYGDKDVLIRNDDVRYLKSKLKTVIHFEKVPGFNHIDFILHKDVQPKVYDTIIKIMSQNL